MLLTGDPVFKMKNLAVLPCLELAAGMLYMTKESKSEYREYFKYIKTINNVVVIISLLT